MKNNTEGINKYIEVRDDYILELPGFIPNLMKSNNNYRD